jgi:hypothetical protein
MTPSNTWAASQLGLAGSGKPPKCSAAYPVIHRYISSHRRSSSLIPQVVEVIPNPNDV